MGKCLYNGVELPALPEWDKTAYPYAFIYIVTLDGTTGVYTLVVSSSSVMSYDDSGIICPSTNVGQRYTVSGDSWAEAADSDDFYIKRDDLIYTVWSNFDILNSDGTVYIAASEPVAVVEKFPLREWVGWLLAGLCSRPLPMGAREPVAYLYNGVRLPALPKEWNKETYFHGVIVYNANYGKYRLFASENEIYFKKLVGITDTIQIPAPHVAFETTGDQWDYEGLTTSNGSGLRLSENTIIWSNVDIPNSEDGSVYFYASEPVPVYE